METSSNGPSSPTNASYPFLTGGGEMGARIRTFDWSKSRLGPIAAWPKSLRTAVSIVLHSPVPLVMFWGEDGVMIYNDAYSRLAGARHPSLLGSKMLEGWPEIADFNKHVLEKCLKGETLSYKDQRLTLYRNNVPEEVWMNLDYSPILGEDGRPAGVLAIVVETTERVLAEQRQKEIEERFQIAMGAAGMIGTWDWHIEKDLFYSDARFASLFSVEPEKGQQGTSISEYMAGIHPDDVERIGKAVQHTIETGEKYSEEYRLLQKDGTIRWIVARGLCLYDEKGNPWRFPGVVVDITERKKAEEALQQQLQLTETILNNASAALVMVDHCGSVVFMNPAAEEVTGYTLEEAGGQSVHALIHHSPPDGSPCPESECPLVQTYKHGKANPLHEEVLFRKDGTPFPALISATPIRGPGGVRETVVEFRDITEEKRAKEGLAESEERFRVMADNIQNLAWMAHPDGWIFWYNRRWYEFTGTTLDEMQGWGWKMVHHPDHVEKVQAFVQEAWLKNEPWELTFPLRRHDGQYQWFLTRAFPIRDREGNILRWIGTNTNIDEQKKALEQKDEFIGVASHELKTPVTSIKAFAQLLQKRFERAGDERSAALLAKMDAQLNKLTTLINDLLDVTNIEAGKLRFYEERFDYNQLINEVVEEMQRTTDKHTIITELGDTALVYGDRDRLGQVLTNLISNAIKYSPYADRIVVTVRTDTESVTTCVRDFGLGISQEDRAKLFERYFRVSGTQQQTFPGMGLGLYVSAEIIKHHGGRIWAESAEGKGSIFSFTIPVQGRRNENQLPNSLVEEDGRYE